MDFRTGFRNIQVSTVTKIRPTTAKLLCAGGHADRQTDTTKLTDAFRNFANVPKILAEYFQHPLFLINSSKLSFMTSSLSGHLSASLLQWSAAPCRMGSASISKEHEHSRSIRLPLSRPAGYWVLCCENKCWAYCNNRRSSMCDSTLVCM